MLQRVGHVGGVFDCDEEEGFDEGEGEDGCVYCEGGEFVGLGEGF